MTQATEELSLEGFAEKLLEEKKLTSLDHEIREQLRRDLTDRLEDAVNAALLEKLPPERAPELDTVLNSGSESEAQEFFKTHVPDADEVIASALLRFKQTYLGS